MDSSVADLTNERTKMSKVLIVEDELARICRPLELKHEGYEVETVLDGRSGLNAALERITHVILLDLMLPN